MAQRDPRRYTGERDSRTLIGVLAVVMSFAAVLVLGILVVSALDRGPSSTATPVAARTPSPSPTVAETGSATVSPSDSPSPTASEAPSGSATASATSSALGAGQTSIRFTGLQLDSELDADGDERAFTFTVAGPGRGIARLERSEGGDAVFCISAEGIAGQTCDTGSEGELFANAAGNLDVTVTLLGSGDATPAVDLLLEFPSTNPSVSVIARFDGTSAPGYNGVAGEFVPTASGEASIQADWGGLPSEFDLVLGTEAASDTSDELSESTDVAAGSPVAFELRNAEQGAGRTRLQVQLRWP